MFLTFKSLGVETTRVPYTRVATKSAYIKLILLNTVVNASSYLIITICYHYYNVGKTLYKSIINLITSNIGRKLPFHESVCSATFKNPFN